MDLIAEKVALRYFVAKWDSLPKGWTEDSLKSFWKSLTQESKHPVTQCIKKMEGKVDDPGAFCASTKDKLEGKGWRSEGKKAALPADFDPSQEPRAQKARYLLRRKSWGNRTQRWLEAVSQGDFNFENILWEGIHRRGTEDDKYEAWKAFKEIDPVAWRLSRSPYKQASKKRALDLHAVRELELFIPNDYQIYSRHLVPTEENLRKKVQRGVYDFNKSIKAFMYVVDAAARKYIQDFAAGDLRTTFPKAVRMEVAKGLAEDFRDEEGL
jgi:hypothetical protein